MRHRRGWRVCTARPNIVGTVSPEGQRKLSRILVKRRAIRSSRTGEAGMKRHKHRREALAADARLFSLTCMRIGARCPDILASISSRLHGKPLNVREHSTRLVAARREAMTKYRRRPVSLARHENARGSIWRLAPRRRQTAIIINGSLMRRRQHRSDIAASR